MQPHRSIYTGAGIEQSAEQTLTALADGDWNKAVLFLRHLVNAHLAPDQLHALSARPRLLGELLDHYRDYDDRHRASVGSGSASRPVSSPQADAASLSPVEQLKLQTSKTTYLRDFLPRLAQAVINLVREGVRLDGESARTALHRMHQWPGSVETNDQLADALLRAGARFDVPDSSGTLPLVHALTGGPEYVDHCHGVDALLAHGARLPDIDGFLEHHRDHSFGMFIHPWSLAYQGGYLDRCLTDLCPFTPARFFDWASGAYATQHELEAAMTSWVESGQLPLAIQDPVTGVGLKHVIVRLAFDDYDGAWALDTMREWAQWLNRAAVPEVDHDGRTPVHVWMETWLKQIQLGRDARLGASEWLQRWEAWQVWGWDPLAADHAGKTPWDLVEAVLPGLTAGLPPERQAQVHRVRDLLHDDLLRRQRGQERAQQLEHVRASDPRPRLRHRS